MMVADKYSLVELRLLCMGHLLQSLTPDNAIAIYFAVEILNLKFGQEVIYSFLRENSKLVLASKSWKEFLEKEPRKAADMLARVLSKDHPPAQKFQVQAPHRNQSKVARVSPN